MNVVSIEMNNCIQYQAWELQRFPFSVWYINVVMSGGRRIILSFTHTAITHMRYTHIAELKQIPHLSSQIHSCHVLHI